MQNERWKHKIRNSFFSFVSKSSLINSNNSQIDRKLRESKEDEEEEEAEEEKKKWKTIAAV